MPQHHNRPDDQTQPRVRRFRAATLVEMVAVIVVIALLLGWPPTGTPGMSPG